MITWSALCMDVLLCLCVVIIINGIAVTFSLLLSFGHVLFQFLCNLQQYCDSAYNKVNSRQQKEFINITNMNYIGNCRCWFYRFLLKYLSADIFVHLYKFQLLERWSEPSQYPPPPHNSFLKFSSSVALILPSCGGLGVKSQLAINRSIFYVCIYVITFVLWCFPLSRGQCYSYLVFIVVFNLLGF